MRIKLYNTTIEVLQVPREEIAKRMGKNGYDGCFDFSKMQILIDRDTEIQATRHILIHELVHAINYIFGYGRWTEEEMCDYVAAHHDEIEKFIRKIEDSSGEEKKNEKI